MFGELLLLDNELGRGLLLWNLRTSLQTLVGFDGRSGDTLMWFTPKDSLNQAPKTHYYSSPISLVVDLYLEGHPHLHCFAGFFWRNLNFSSRVQV